MSQFDMSDMENFTTLNRPLLLIDCAHDNYLMDGIMVYVLTNLYNQPFLYLVERQRRFIVCLIVLVSLSTQMAK